MSGLRDALAEALGPAALVAADAVRRGDYGEDPEPHDAALAHADAILAHPAMVAALRATDVPSERELDHIAWAQHVRAEHEATHGEAEQCGAECIVLGLTDFDDDEPPRATDVPSDGLRCAHERAYPGWCYTHDAWWLSEYDVCQRVRLAATPDDGSGS